VWAAGCVLYELCTLRKAFDGASLPALVVKILRGRYPPVASRYSAELRRLVDSLLKQNPRVNS
jgi:NIMA (never in mitosis gene a)-related kinase